MLIAIDHGNYAIKTPHFSFISGLSEHTVKPPLADEVLEFGGSYWTLSGKRLPYMRDKTKDERFFILSLFAIAREIEMLGAQTAFEQIDLAVGLPPEHYGMLREKFAQYFRRSGAINFVYKERPLSIVIRHVLVYAFVKGIQFYADNSITIEFRYMNEFEELLQECERIRKGVA